MKLLKQLYLKYSPSGSETTGSIVKRELNRLGIEFKTLGNAIYALNSGQPLLSSHLDQIISEKPATKVFVNDGIISGNGALGCDDKNGIWVTLQVLEKYPELSFIFSDCEESGGKELNKIVQFDAIDDIPYALIIDRKGASDIICAGNYYASMDMQDHLHEIGLMYGYSPNVGIYSDADILSQYIPCANLSCGYYNPHTNNDLTIISELYNCRDYVIDIIDKSKGMEFALGDFIFNNEEICYCGYFLEDDWSYCPNCGQPVSFNSMKGMKYESYGKRL